jgi:hypothetical protein
MEQLDFQINERYMQSFPAYCAEDEEVNGYNRNDHISKRTHQNNANHMTSNFYHSNEQLNFGGGFPANEDDIFKNSKPIYIQKGDNTASSKEIFFSSSAIKRKKLERSLPQKENKAKKANLETNKGLFKKSKSKKKKHATTSVEKKPAMQWNTDVKSNGLFDPMIRKNQLRNEEFLKELEVKMETKQRPGGPTQRAASGKTAPQFETYKNIYEIQSMMDEGIALLTKNLIF